MKNTIKTLVALLICAANAQGQITRTANVFPNTSTTAGIWVSELNSINNLTIQCWVKRSVSTGKKTIVSNQYLDNLGHWHFDLLFQFINDTLTAQIGNNTINTTIIDTDWFHVALTKHNDSMFLYTNGTLVASNVCNTNSYTFSATTMIIAGMLDTTTSTMADTFIGNMNDLRIDTTITAIHYDTCNYNSAGALIYAAMNNTDSQHIYYNGTAAAMTFGLSETSPCGDTTTTTTTIKSVSPANQEISIAPNPTQTSIAITSSVPVVNVCIQNLLGQIVC